MLFATQSFSMPQSAQCCSHVRQPQAVPEATRPCLPPARALDADPPPRGQSPSHPSPASFGPQVLWECLVPRTRLQVHSSPSPLPAVATRRIVGGLTSGSVALRLTPPNVDVPLTYEVFPNVSSMASTNLLVFPSLSTIIKTLYCQIASCLCVCVCDFVRMLCCVCVCVCVSKICSVLFPTSPISGHLVGAPRALCIPMHPLRPLCYAPGLR
eukprot:GGOE01029045.1.p1 GENE.GGOE01029045.1~~GGOE01029045.1.p1  ORF type:complete len:212 (+),score=6.93 GGOE01029045.1:456-1091(+)